MTTTRVSKVRFIACSVFKVRLSDSAYIFIGGLNLELTEGDVISIFSQ